MLWNFLKLDLKENEEILNSLSEKGNSPISYQQGVSLSQKINATKYIECSSVTREGVDCIFSEITKLARLQSKLTKKKTTGKLICHLLWFKNQYILINFKLKWFIFT